MGKQPYPLKPDVLFGREHLLACPAVLARAGQGASPQELAQAASEVLSELIVGLPDETDRRIAEAAFAYEEAYQKKSIGERQDRLNQLYGISKNVYADRRLEVFSKLIYGLQAGPQAPIGALPLHPATVGKTATLFYYATVATRLLVSERIRLLGPNAPLLRWPNPALYSSHVKFLLFAHRYLYTLHNLEAAAKPHLEPILNEIVASGPFDDSVYLAHIYGGLDEPGLREPELNDAADRRLQDVWRAWYKNQDDSGADAGSALHTVSTAVLRFRNNLPIVSGLDTETTRQLTETDHHASQLQKEVRSGIELAQGVLKQYLDPEAISRRQTDKHSRPRMLTDIFDTPKAREKWLADMMKQVEAIVLLETRATSNLKQWDMELERSIVLLRLRQEGNIWYNI